MLILGIETATAQVGCAIGGHEGVLGAIHSSRGRRHAETLTPAIEFLCQQTRVALADIGVVAVDLGPGMFTGLRVGVAAGKAIAHARRLPMIGVTSLDLLAFPLRHSHRRIVCALDAGRGELFHATYRQSPGGVQRLTTPEVTTPADLASDLDAARDAVLLAGDGAIRHAELFEPIRGVELADHRAVRAGVLGKIGRNHRADGDLPARQQPLPRVVVRDEGADRLAEPFDQRFVAEEEEGAVPADRPAQGGAELVAPEIRLLAGVEVIA